MPTYQYRCQDCSSELEVVQKFTDDPLTRCPSCDGALRKVYSAVGVVFKGSGFYATDSRAAKKKSGGSGSSSSGEGKSGTESRSGTESKPAAETSKPSGAGSPAKPSGASTSGAPAA